MADGKRPLNIRKMEADFRALAKELEIAQHELADNPATSRAEEINKMADELLDLQGKIDQYNRISGIVQETRKVDSPTLPSDRKEQRHRVRTTPGHLFVASEAFKKYRAAGKEGWSAKVEIGNLRGSQVTLTGDEAIEFERKAFDAATLSDLGTDAIIEVDRDRELVRYEEPEILTIRDLLNVVPTSSDSVRYVRHKATTRGAASQASRGGLKSYLKVEFEPVTTSVETIAVLSKVTEQDIDDAPRLVGYINSEMRLDVKVEEERQLLHGSGEDGEIEGLYAQGVEDNEFEDSQVGDNLIDTIRRMRAHLRKQHRVIPTGVLIDPMDWAGIELVKRGSNDDAYVWGVVTDLRGPRIWSLRVVESDAMEHPETGERRILMGDFTRGATLYDRHDVRLAVGYVDDDFARNLRTLRAEERLALAVKRAHAFTYAVTDEGGS